MTAQPPAQAAEPGCCFSIPEGSDINGLDLALDAMAVGIFEYDLSSGVPRFSERCKTIWGFDVTEEVTAQMVHDRIHPDDVRLVSSIMPLGHPRYSIEHRIVLPDGTIRWVLVSGQALFEETDGVRRITRLCGAMHDITERKVAEQQLYERKSQLRAFVEGAPVPIAILDNELRYVAASARYAEERRLTTSDLIGRSMYAVFPTLPEHWLTVHRTVLDGATQSCDGDLFVLPDGSRQWVRWEMHPWYRADNEVGGIILFAEFITQAMEAQQALRDSQTRLELAVHAGSLGIYEYDFTTGVADWDARSRSLWGFAPEETISYENFLGAIHPDDRAMVDRMLTQASAAGSSGLLQQDYRIVNRADGSLRWLDVHGRVYTEGGHVRIIGVMRDITDRKHTELALARSAAELRRADERKDVYLATLSHELRNPLAPIRTAAHLLASPRLTGEQLKWVTQVIRRQTAHMASLLEDLLDISRVSHGKLTLRRERVPLAGIVQPALESARPIIDEKRHALTVIPPREPLTVCADPQRLSQILSNLLTNAAKYTDPGGRIELTLGAEGGDLVIGVRDNGIGIDPVDLEKIFTMFWQADGRSTQCRGGLGIGLAFVEGIVKLHGGSIEARSEGRGRGSLFIVRLPVLVPAQPAAPPQAPAAAARTTQRRRILVAEDDGDTADTLEMLLRLADHEVRVAHSGREAVAAAREFRPDIALLDLGLPGLNGYGVARALRREPWAAGLRLIALTGWGHPDNLHRVRAAGFEERLMKPVDPERLRRAID